MHGPKKILAAIYKFRHSKQSRFYLTAFFLLAILVGFSIYLLTFLITNLNIALGSEKKRTPVQTFELEKFESLNLIQKK